MTDEEIHDFGIQVVTKELEKESHQVLSVDTDIDRNPQIVATINGHLAFIAVRTAAYPGNGTLTELELINRLIEHAKTHTAILYFASVGIANSQGVDSGDEALSATPIRGAGFYVNYRGLQILTSAANVKVVDKSRLTDLIPKDLNKNAFSKAVEHLAGNLGSLDDLPSELANTIANIYYRAWEQWIALAPMRKGTPAPAAIIFDHPDGALEGYRQFTKKSSSLVAGYKHAASMISAIRDTQRKHPDRKDLVHYMVQVALDSLKYDIDNAHQKTPIRRSIERRFKKPEEISDLYERMRPLITALLRSARSGSEHAG